MVIEQAFECPLGSAERARRKGAYATSSLSGLMVLLTVLVLLFFLLLASTVRADGGDSSSPAEAYVVQPGETLWAIAERRTPGGGDVRRSVFEIRRTNGLSGSGLRPGQVLLLPSG